MLLKRMCSFAGCEGEVQAGLLERIRSRAGLLARLPGSELLEGPCPASAAGCEPSLPVGRHILVLVRHLLHGNHSPYALCTTFLWPMNSCSTWLARTLHHTFPCLSLSRTCLACSGSSSRMTGRGFCQASRASQPALSQKKPLFEPPSPALPHVLRQCWAQQQGKLIYRMFVPHSLYSLQRLSIVSVRRNPSVCVAF